MFKRKKLMAAILCMCLLFANVCTNEKFLYSAFYQYDNKAIMSFLEKAELIAGMGDGTFSPRTYLSRAEAAVVISRLIDYIEQ